MAEVVVIPIVAALANAVAHATGRRVRELPLTPARILEALA
jgi:CO/xanthine dehydrogenase Mo-binding subunit